MTATATRNLSFVAPAAYGLLLIAISILPR
jgi:hypothetical protein